jgi:predicted lipoprotein
MNIQKLPFNSGRWLLVLLIMLAVSGCTIATIRPLDPVTGKAIIGDEDQRFNAANYVAEIWDAQVVPLLQQNATDINTVLDALRQDQAAASEQYGRRTDTRQPYSFVVSGSGTVTSVNTESRAGLAQVDTNGDGEADVSLAIGPVIRGTALRDGMPFITFNQFTNQMEYAAVSNEINALVNQRILTPLGDPQVLEGKQVTFAGAFLLANVDEIIVTPGILTVSG